jgi:hypothetical protein
MGICARQEMSKLPRKGASMLSTGRPSFNFTFLWDLRKRRRGFRERNKSASVENRWMQEHDRHTSHISPRGEEKWRFGVPRLRENNLSFWQALLRKGPKERHTPKYAALAWIKRVSPWPDAAENIPGRKQDAPA